jgi:hypothetical protein
MGKTARILVGIATIIQILMILSYVVVIFYDAETIHLTTIIYLGFVNAWTLLLQIIYLIDLYNSSVVLLNDKTKWIALLLLFSPISMPIYWFKYIWPNK